jgi:hypothetical protein
MALNKEVLEGWTEPINRHCIETSLNTKPTNLRYASSFTKFLINIKLMFEGMIFSVQRLEFNYNVLS